MLGHIPHLAVKDRVLDLGNKNKLILGRFGYFEAGALTGRPEAQASGSLCNTH